MSISRRRFVPAVGVADAFCTFSKLYGMSGLRLGYAVGQSDGIAALRRHRLADSVNALAAAAAAAAGVDGPVPSKTTFVIVDVRRDVQEYHSTLEETKAAVGVFRNDLSRS